LRERNTIVSRRLEPLMAITKYSVDDYEEMIRLGVLTEKERSPGARDPTGPTRKHGC
jgi:hypothetical protein